MQDIYYRALVMHVYKTTSVLRIQEHKLAISSLLKDAWITNLLQVELNLEHQLIESCLVWNCTRTYYKLITNLGLHQLRHPAQFGGNTGRNTSTISYV